MKKKIYQNKKLPLEACKTKIVQFANSIDPDEVAHNEPSHLGLHYLLYSLRALNMNKLGKLMNFAAVTFFGFCGIKG